MLFETYYKNVKMVIKIRERIVPYSPSLLVIKTQMIQHIISYPEFSFHNFCGYKSIMVKVSPKMSVMTISCHSYAFTGYGGILKEKYALRYHTRRKQGYLEVLT